MTNENTGSVRNQGHQLELDISHPQPAYAGEKYPITITVKNEDPRTFDITLDVLLHPSEVDDAIRIDDETSTSLIKGVSLGKLVTGSTTNKTVYVLLDAGAGERVLDISLQSQPISDSIALKIPLTQSPDETITTLEEPAAEDSSELLRTLVVPTIMPFSATHATNYRRSVTPAAKFADLHSFDADHWDDGAGGEAFVRSIFECVGPWTVNVDSVVMVREVRQRF
jgi:trafficking protein particle complex subunit 11